MVLPSSDLVRRSRRTLLQCSEFDSDASLRAVFMTDELAPFRSRLPQAASRSERVDLCVSYLLEKRLSDGRPVLSIFLAAVRDRYLPGDALRSKLETLAEQLEYALASVHTVLAAEYASQNARAPSTETLTWLHLSDFHFRAAEQHTWNENIVLRALLEDVRTCISEKGLTPDLILVSGDVAFSGATAEYALACDFFDQLQAATGLAKEQILVVPGNHDVDRSSISRGAQAICDSLNDRDSTNAVLVTPGDRQLVFARFQSYAAFVNDCFRGHLSFDDQNYFYVRMLDQAGERIAVLGLNSAWMCASDGDKAKGLLLGERQVRTALEMAREAGATLRIALLHHPFDWLREFDQNDSSALLIDNCDFVLHGHLHQTALTQLTSPDSAAMVIGGGASYETRQQANRYNWIQLDLNAGSGTIYLRRYSDERGGFGAKDTLTYRNAPDGVYSFSFRKGLTGPQRVAQPTRAVVASPAARPSTFSSGGEVTAAESEALSTSSRDLADLRRQLNQRFDDAGLDAFCLDHFPDVYDKFGRGMRKDEKITLLLDHCRRLPAYRQRLLNALEELAA